MALDRLNRDVTDQPDCNLRNRAIQCQYDKKMNRLARSSECL